MGGKVRKNGTSRVSALQEQVKGLEEDKLHLNLLITNLESDIIALKEINIAQCTRLGEESLLRVRIAELESKTKEDSVS